MKVKAQLSVGFAIAVALCLALSQGAAASESASISPVFKVPSFAAVPHAESTLTRRDDGIAFSFHTSELTPGVSATLLLVIFNNPAGCSHGVAGLRCGEGDAVPGGPQQASAVLVTQTTIGCAGRLAGGGRLDAGNASGAVFGPGLTNPGGADVHLVVRQDGAVVQASPHEAA